MLYRWSRRKSVESVIFDRLRWAKVGSETTDNDCLCVALIQVAHDVQFFFFLISSKGDLRYTLGNSSFDSVIQSLRTSLHAALTNPSAVYQWKAHLLLDFKYDGVNVLEYEKLTKV
jgi:hypothetical protein